MYISRQTVIVILAPIVIVGCLATLFWPKGEENTLTKPHEALGYFWPTTLRNSWATVRGL